MHQLLVWVARLLCLALHPARHSSISHLLLLCSRKGHAAAHCSSACNLCEIRHQALKPPLILALPQLKRDIITYYEYNDFMADAILNLFPFDEAVEFIQVSFNAVLESSMLLWSCTATWLVVAVLALWWQALLQSIRLCWHPRLTAFCIPHCRAGEREEAADHTADQHAAGAAAGRGGRPHQPRRQPRSHRRLVQGAPLLAGLLLPVQLAAIICPAAPHCIGMAFILAAADSSGSRRHSAGSAPSRRPLHHVEAASFHKR